VRTRLEAVDQKTVISLEVMDTGIGIPEEAMDRMFQPFSQAEKSTTRKFGGTGLGLSISKRLVDLMGGKIHLTSEFGKGTTFSVQLQLETGRQIEKQVVDEIQKLALASNSRKRPTLLGRVLVAEDNTTNQKVIARMLEKWGCKYHIVANGNEVLDVMRDTRFDLILMDCQMPEMDGYTATRLIRQSNPLAQNTPIVALTANAISGDETLCVQAGMNGYLTKPVDMRDLEAVLVKYLKIDTRDQVASEV
ncbi:MAG: response regulator, partial [Bdellovibrionota bacterium]